MGEVVAIEQHRRPSRPRKVSGAQEMPAQWTATDKVELLTWAKSRGYCIEELNFATETVRDWYEGDRAKRKRENWPSVMKNAMRAGWALKGFEKEMTRRGFVDVNARTGGVSIRRTAITDERIERWQMQCK